jgi:hypothetical protein
VPTGTVVACRKENDSISFVAHAPTRAASALKPTRSFSREVSRMSRDTARNSACATPANDISATVHEWHPRRPH